MSGAPRWRVRGVRVDKGWVLVGRGHPASNRRGLSSGSRLLALAEMNGSEVGSISGGPEEEENLPGQEEEKKQICFFLKLFAYQLTSYRTPCFFIQKHFHS